MVLSTPKNTNLLDFIPVYLKKVLIFTPILIKSTTAKIFDIWMFKKVNAAMKSSIFVAIYQEQQKLVHF